MKIEKLSLNKIKVTVSPYDLSVWDISLEALNPESPFLHEFIRSLVRRAENEMGFDADCRRWVIEVMPQGSEFIFLITRMDDESAVREERENMRHKMQNRQFRVVKKAVLPVCAGECIYSFETFENFAAMLGSADTDEFKQSTLYKMGGKYYLKTRQASASDDNSVREPSAALLSEFGSRVNDTLLGARLAEYGVEVAKGDDFAQIRECF